VSAPCMFRSRSPLRTPQGRFPRRPEDVPLAVVEATAAQVGVPAAAWRGYDWDGRAIRYHRAQIRSALGFREVTVEDAAGGSGATNAHAATLRSVSLAPGPRHSIAPSDIGNPPTTAAKAASRTPSQAADPPAVPRRRHRGAVTRGRAPRVRGEAAGR
jgi:Domain of unknown function (DUF4158)